ncbi:nuclear transport factor 2 family protein, partial [Streptomyces mirabilis]|uniref:nuclear transport factor 2 family protein n=1 Tax=Streptomyces mirabilis TaxID=68239 RepID=UPI0036B4F205
MTAQTETQPYSATGFAALYAEIQQFYARHMHLLDSGATDEWAADFTEDASFSVPTLPAPVSGRDAFGAGGGPYPAPHPPPPGAPPPTAPVYGKAPAGGRER